MKNKYIVILIVLISLLFASKKFFLNSDEKQITKMLNAIEEVGTFDELLKPMAVVLRLKQIEKMFKDDVVIKVFNFDNNFYEGTGFEEAKASLFLGAKLIYANKVLRTNTNIDVNEGVAEASYFLLASGKDKSSSKYRELFSVLAKLEKSEKNWLFTEVTIDRITEENESNE